MAKVYKNKFPVKCRCFLGEESIYQPGTLFKLLYVDGDNVWLKPLDDLADEEVQIRVDILGCVFEEVG